MTLLAEIRRLANDIVLPVRNCRDKRSILLVYQDLDMVTHSYRIGAADAFEPKISLDLTLDNLSIIRLDGVPATCILNDKSFHALHCHDFLVLGSDQVINFLDVLVMCLLQFCLGIFLIVL